MILSFLFFGVVSFANAQSYNFAEQSGLKTASEQAGYQTDNNKDLASYIRQIVTIILSVLGVVFLGFTIYGGLLWMTAQGNEDHITRAKDIITESIIGLIIVLAAYAISYFVISYLTKVSIIS